MDITRCHEWIHTLATDNIKMRAIINNTHLPSDMRYQAVIIEEQNLELIVRYVELIKTKQNENIHSYNPKD